MSIGVPTGYMVNGSAIVWTDVTGSWQVLGYTDAGVDMNVQQNKGEILTDVMGPMTPQDFQDFGMTARVVCPFIMTVRAQMDAIIAVGDSFDYGSTNTPGIVIGENDFKFGIYIESSFDAPWTFENCLVRPGFGTKLAVKANVFRFEFYAWPYASSNTFFGGDIPLFNRSVQ